MRFNRTRFRPRGGMNLADLAYYAAEIPFQNHASLTDESMVSSINFGWNNGPALTYTADGYPNNLTGTNNHVAILVVGFNASVPDGTQFTLTWSGPATGVTMDGASNGNNTATYTRTGTSDTLALIRINQNGITNLVLRRTSEPITGTFRQPFIDRVKKYHCVRFMNWGVANVSNTFTWAGRRTQSHRSQATITKGCSLEHMVQLCNETGVSGWFTIHHTTSDADITSYCNFIKNNRVGNWKVYLEWSNEWWNSIFPQRNYCQIQGGNVNPWDWYGYGVQRTREMATLARATGLEHTSVIGLQAAGMNDHEWYLNPYKRWTLTRNASAGNFTITINGQTTANIAYNADASAIASAISTLIGAANLTDVVGTGPFIITFKGNYLRQVNTVTLNAGGLTQTGTNSIVRTDDHYPLTGIDAIAVAPYFGGHMHQEPYLSNVIANGVSQVHTYMDAHIDADVTDWMTRCRDVAKLHGKQYIGYEGGQHAQITGNASATAIFVSANQHATMYDLTLKWARKWNEISGGALMCYFNSVYYDYLNGVPNESGTWGAMTREGQPLNEAHKYRAWLDYLAENKQ